MKKSIIFSLFISLISVQAFAGDSLANLVAEKFSGSFISNDCPDQFVNIELGVAKKKILTFNSGFDDLVKDLTQGEMSSEMKGAKVKYGTRKGGEAFLKLSYSDETFKGRRLGSVTLIEANENKIYVSAHTELDKYVKTSCTKPLACGYIFKAVESRDVTCTLTRI